MLRIQAPALGSNVNTGMLPLEDACLSQSRRPFLDRDVQAPSLSGRKDQPVLGHNALYNVGDAEPSAARLDGPYHSNPDLTSRQ